MDYAIKCRICGNIVSSVYVESNHGGCPHCKDPFITEAKAQQVRKAEQKEKDRQKNIANGICPVCFNPLRTIANSVTTPSGYTSYDKLLVCPKDENHCRNGAGRLTRDEYARITGIY